MPKRRELARPGTVLLFLFRNGRGDGLRQAGGGDIAIMEMVYIDIFRFIVVEDISQKPEGGILNLGSDSRQILHPLRL